jgi:hypothetical protein
MGQASLASVYASDVLRASAHLIVFLAYLIELAYSTIEPMPIFINSAQDNLLMKKA